MRAWHLLLVTVAICLLLLFREVPGSLTTKLDNQPKSNAWSGASTPAGGRSEISQVTAGVPGRFAAQPVAEQSVDFQLPKSVDPVASVQSMESLPAAIAAPLVREATSSPTTDDLSPNASLPGMPKVTTVVSSAPPAPCLRQCGRERGRPEGGGRRQSVHGR